MRLVQLMAADDRRAVAAVSEDGRALNLLRDTGSTYQLAQEAIAENRTLAELANARIGAEVLDYEDVARAGRLLPPVDHPDPAHCLVTGTGLSHLGSAQARQDMHVKLSGGAEENLTDSMKMFKMGLDGGKPAPGQTGAQPEWFYKGDGGCLAAPEQPLEMPAFALDGGEEPELAALYLIGADGTPWRLGFALGNEFSDHVTEQRNYLLLAHSKLRACAIGPELRLGDLPDDIRGTSRIRRGNAVIFEKEFLTGEANMSHTIANLEHHHFKYTRFRRPGDLHVHFLGTGTVSFADGIETRPGDIFEIEAAEFGRPLRNPLRQAEAETVEICQL